MHTQVLTVARREAEPQSRSPGAVCWEPDLGPLLAAG